LNNKGTDLCATGLSEARYPRVEADHSPRDSWGVWVLTGNNFSRSGYLSRGTPCNYCIPRRKNIEAFSRLFPTRYSRLCDGHLALHPGPPNHLRARLGARIRCTEDINIKKQSSSKRAAFCPVGQQFITLQIPSTARSRLAWLLAIYLGAVVAVIPSRYPPSACVPNNKQRNIERKWSHSISLCIPTTSQEHRAECGATCSRITRTLLRDRGMKGFDTRFTRLTSNGLVMPRLPQMGASCGGKLELSDVVTRGHGAFVPAIQARGRA
jgi:hypothetical protein